MQNKEELNYFDPKKEILKILVGSFVFLALGLYPLINAILFLPFIIIADFLEIEKVTGIEVAYADNWTPNISFPFLCLVYIFCLSLFFLFKKYTHFIIKLCVVFVYLFISIHFFMFKLSDYPGRCDYYSDENKQECISTYVFDIINKNPGDLSTLDLCNKNLNPEDKKSCAGTFVGRNANRELCSSLSFDQYKSFFGDDVVGYTDFIYNRCWDWVAHIEANISVCDNSLPLDDGKYHRYNKDTCYKGMYSHESGYYCDKIGSSKIDIDECIIFYIERAVNDEMCRFHSDPDLCKKVKSYYLDDEVVIKQKVYDGHLERHLGLYFKDLGVENGCRLFDLLWNNRFSDQVFYKMEVCGLGDSGYEKFYNQEINTSKVYEDGTFVIRSKSKVYLIRKNSYNERAGGYNEIKDFIFFQ